MHATLRKGNEKLETTLLKDKTHTISHSIKPGKQHSYKLKTKRQQKSGKIHENKKLPRKVAPTMPKVPRCLKNSISARSNVKKDL